MEKAGGKPLDIRKSMEVFGSKVYWHTHKSKRSKVAPTKTEGIWVGHSNTVLGGHRVLPIHSDDKMKMWKVQPAQDVKSATIFNGNFTLRKVASTKQVQTNQVKV